MGELKNKTEGSFMFTKNSLCSISGQRLKLPWGMLTMFLGPPMEHKNYEC